MQNDSSVSRPPAVDVLGVPISLIDIDRAVSIILEWVRKCQANYVCVRDVHGVMRSLEDPAMIQIHRNAGLVTPDGMPLVWILKVRSKANIGRVCGADLMEALCDAGRSIGLRHYFYGGKPGIAKQVATKLNAKYPGIKIAGFLSPPFTSVPREEDAEITARIVTSKANVVWIGISTPKQEFWMRDHVAKIPDATLIGVGAAFDFHAGAVARAPRWMQKFGLEWVHRLLSEPTRLWRRYLLLAPIFLAKVIKEQVNLGLNKARAKSGDDISMGKST